MIHASTRGGGGGGGGGGGRGGGGRYLFTNYFLGVMELVGLSMHCTLDHCLFLKSHTWKRKGKRSSCACVHYHFSLPCKETAICWWAR